MRMRRLMGVFSILGTMLGAAAASRAAEAETMPDWFFERLRKVEAEQGPAGLFDMACTFFDRAGGTDMNGYAFRTMQEAADAGHDKAALYLSSYLNQGVGTKRNEEAADRLLMRLVTKIRQKRSPHFPTMSDAAREIFSGRCGPSDRVTAFSLYQVDESCRSAPEPKPEWCG